MDAMIAHRCRRHGVRLITTELPEDTSERDALMLTLLDDALAVWVEQGVVLVDGQLLRTLTDRSCECPQSFGELQLFELSPLSGATLEAIEQHRRNFPYGRAAGKAVPGPVTTSTNIQIRAVVTPIDGPVRYRLAQPDTRVVQLGRARDINAHPVLVQVLEALGQEGAAMLADAGNQWPDVLAAAADALAGTAPSPGTDTPIEPATVSDPSIPTGLLAVAVGQVRHTNAGRCPDAANGYLARDPQCPACQAIESDAERVLWQEWGAVLDDAGSTDTYATRPQATAAVAAHGGELVHIAAYRTSAQDPTALPGTRETLTALQQLDRLRAAAAAAYAAAHDVTVADLEAGDENGVQAVKTAIRAALAGSDPS